MKSNMTLSIITALLMLFSWIALHGADLVFPTNTAFGPGANAADVDSLESMVRYLAIDPTSSQPRSRYAFRESDLRSVADSLVSRLERYTGTTALRQSFEVSYHDSTFAIENISCRVQASGNSSGVLLVTAHFDAISRRGQENWEEDWVDLEAPGADDNATGVAAVIEAARILSPLNLPFDIEFVLFTAEELGRLGSIHYVSLCDEECAEGHIGAINTDMIGYSGAGTGVSVLSNFRSGWLADMIIAYAADIDPTLEAALIKPAPSNWDHQSFWESANGKLTAITLSETLGPTGSILYPDYHTIGDLPENVDFEQTERIASLINEFIASFVDKPAENSMLQSDLLVQVNGAIRYNNVFMYGEEISILARVRNTGGMEPPEGANVRLDIWLENAGGRTRVFSDVVFPAAPLRSTDTEIPLGTGSGLAGQNIVTAEITVAGMADDLSDNNASADFVMQGTGSGIENHFFKPNPMNCSFSESIFCINLSEEVNIALDIHSLEGEILGSARLGSGYGYPISTGLSCHPCCDIFPGMNDLASGIYIYRIVSFTGSVETGSYLGRFAVER